MHARASAWLLLAFPPLLLGCRSRPAAGDSDPAAQQRAPAQGGAIRFVDASARAGISFAATNSRSASKHLVETMGSGCAFLDYDNDGFQDILLLNGRPLPGAEPSGTEQKAKPTLKLYRNRRNGTFEDATGKSGMAITMFAMGCAVGDFDNDGFEDVYVTGVLGPGKLLRNDGRGRFRDVTSAAGVGNAGMWGTSCAWVDVDGDGRLDLFVCNYVTYRTLADDVPCLINLNSRSYCLPGVFKPSHCTLYRNDGARNGHPSFTDVSRSSGIGVPEGKSLGVAVWDYDQDGRPDLYVANDTTPGFLFHNLGGCRFEEVGVEAGVAYDEQGRPHTGMGIDVADAGNDGSSWLVITNYSGQETSMYHQVSPDLYEDRRLATGVGPPSTASLGFGAGFLDADNDGLRDLLVINGHVQDDIALREPGVSYAERPFLYRNLGRDRFREVGESAGLDRPIVGRGLAWGDYDNDGRVDALVTTNGGPAYLWHNETPQAGNWIELRLQGSRSNRSAIGAVVTATSGRTVQRTMVRSGSSYLSASDLRVHFGLGRETKADVTVRWPSGSVQELGPLDARRIYRVVEGAGAVP